jgi:hypothetical protein
MTMLAYVSSAFSGYRGSRRFKFIRYNSTSIVGDTGNYATQTEPILKGGWSLAADGDAIQTYSTYQHWVEANKTTWRGCVIAVEPASKVLDFEVPFYTNQRFLSTFQTSSEPKQQADFHVTYSNIVGITHSFSLLDNFTFDIYSAIGDDYNLFFFCGVPPIWSSA